MKGSGEARTLGIADKTCQNQKRGLEYVNKQDKFDQQKVYRL